MEGDCKIKNDVQLKINFKPTQQILRERGLNEGGEVQKYIDSEVIRLMAKFTPKRDGNLINSATKLTEIGSGEIRQGGDIAPYARKWYRTKANFTEPSTRGTYWFYRMKQNGGAKSILQGIVRIVSK